MQQTTFTGTSTELRALLWSFVAALSGSGGQFAPYVRGLKLRAGMVALAEIQTAFVAKAAGGTGEDGIQWPPLKKQTIANRRLGPSDVAGLREMGITKRQYGYGARRQGPNDLDIKGRLKRGFLTEEQDKRWRMIFATRKNWLQAKFGLSDGAASARAAQIAWSILKSEGAKTKLEVLGNRKVMIMRDSGRLFNSLSPGVEDPAKYPLLSQVPEVENRILREEAGAIVVGTNVLYAARQHRLRPLWPTELPLVWGDRIAEAVGDGVAEAIIGILHDAA